MADGAVDSKNKHAISSQGTTDASASQVVLCQFPGCQTAQLAPAAAEICSGIRVIARRRCGPNCTSLTTGLLTAEAGSLTRNKMNQVEQ